MLANNVLHSVIRARSATPRRALISGAVGDAETDPSSSSASCGAIDQPGMRRCPGRDDQAGSGPGSAPRSRPTRPKQRRHRVSPGGVAIHGHGRIIDHRANGVDTGAVDRPGHHRHRAPAVGILARKTPVELTDECYASLAPGLDDLPCRQVGVTSSRERCGSHEIARDAAVTPRRQHSLATDAEACVMSTEEQTTKDESLRPSRLRVDSVDREAKQSK